MTPSAIKTDFFSGITVALALVPEAIAFALVAHVSPLTGLYAAFFLCLISASFGGRPGMISGATGALAVVMVSIVTQHGVEYLFASVVLMGVLQLLFGAFKLGKFIRMVPHSVMLGFVNGLALVMTVAQAGHFKRDGQWLAAPQLAVMAALTVLTMAIIYLLPRLSRAIPAALAAILIVAGVVAGFGIDTKTVGDMGSIAGGLPQFHLPQVPLTLDTLTIILPYSLVLAAIGLLESLLTLNLIDDITDSRGQPNREALAQGGGNVVAGLFATMGGCVLIGQSMININNGARHRLSGIAFLDRRFVGPHRRVGPLPRQTDRELDALVRAGHGGDVGRVLLGHQHLLHQRMPHHGQAHSGVARPYMGENVLQGPLQCLQVGAVFEIADKQQALAVRAGADVLIVLGVHAVDHHSGGATGELADQLGVAGADRHHFTRLAQHPRFPAPVAPAVEAVEWAQPQGQAVLAHRAGVRLHMMLADHERQAAGLQGLFERLEAVAVLDLDDVPGLVQQLLEAVSQTGRQAIDDGPHGVVDDR